MQTEILLLFVANGKKPLRRSNEIYFVCLSVKTCYVTLKGHLHLFTITSTNYAQSFARPWRDELRCLPLFAVQGQTRHFMAIICGTYEECAYSTNILKARWTQIMSIRLNPDTTCVALHHAFV